MNKRELVQTAFDGKAGDRVPVGFWWHFTGSADHASGYLDNGIVEESLAGHKKMIEDFQPDMVKIMSDGFFCHPGLVENKVRSVADLRKIRPITKEHPWVRKQVDVVARVLEMTKGEVIAIYNIFSAVQQLRIYLEHVCGDLGSCRGLVMEHTAETMDALKIVEEDTRMLLDELKAHTGVDGIYYSVQMLQYPEADHAFHDQWIVPSDMAVLNHINKLWEYNMLHICGYEHHHNDVGFYAKYPCKAYNWATHTENISLKQGKEIFKSCVCGGFDNNKGSLIDTGTIEELARYTKELIADAGREGLIIGADCTLHGDIDHARFCAIRDAGK